MKMTLRTKLMLSFAVTALMCVLLIGVTSNWQLEKHFRLYILQNQQQQRDDIAEMMITRLAANPADDETVRDIGLYAMRQGLILQVRDPEGRMLWDAYAEPEGPCRQLISDMSRQLQADPPGWDGRLKTETARLVQGNLLLGTMDITYCSSALYNDVDTHFIRTLNGVFLVVGAISLLLAVLIGVWLSRRISKPLAHATQVAHDIGRGTRGIRIQAGTSTIEIIQLADTVNQLAASLESQEARRSRLTGDLAHELRTPLATLQAHLETMIDGIWEPSIPRLEGCHEEILRISRLVSDLEHLAQYDSDTLLPEKREIPADPYLRRLLEPFLTSFHRKGIRMVMDCDGSILYADKDKLSQVIVNLMSNALKYTSEGGTVTLRVRSTGEGTTLTVEDTGTGIPETDLPHVFDRLYRADVSRNRTTGGSGIGLALAKAIIEAHGGRITVSSKEGIGTSFHLLLPGKPDPT